MTNTTTTKRPNRFAGTCDACGLPVPAGEGILVGKVNGRWVVGHAPCPGYVEDAPTEVRQAWRAHVNLNARPARPVFHRYVGMTWAEVREANEFFDGEVEAEAAAHQEWVIANAKVQLGGTPYAAYLDTRTPWGDPDEAAMHAIEAWGDAQDR